MSAVAVEEIDKMEAGAELDALMADFMGWRWYEVSWLGTSGEYFASPSDVKNWEREAMSYKPLEGRAPTVHGGVPRYSSDIRAAWAVLEKLKEKHGDVQLYSGPFTKNEGFWECQIEDSRTDGVIVCVEAETPSLAICRAARKAMQRASATGDASDTPSAP